MYKIFNTLFKNSMVGAVGLITLFMLTGLLYLVPHLSKEQSKQDAYLESQRIVNYIKIFRAYYNDNVLSKIKAHSDLKINFDHKTKETTIPLPATLVHDLGDLFTNSTDLSVAMYSDFPFPNREDRKLDKFQTEALASVLKNPSKDYSREEILVGKPVLRTVFADFLTAESCVTCHNTRADTPKDTWKLGDIRGVIEVSIPLHTSFGSGKILTYSILLFILLNFSILSIYYFFYMKRKNRRLENKVTNKDKILSEYKKAVDLGAIVSKADTHGIITYVNDAFVEISGYSREELINHPHSIVKHPDSSTEMFKELWLKIKNREVWQGDIKNLSKDGHDYYVYATIVPIVDEHNKVIEYLAIRYETTKLHQAIFQANEAERIKSRFLANMSHELRTPLNAIIGFSQILQRKSQLNERDLSYIEKISFSGKSLLTLVNSILDFSKIEEGEMEYHPSQINIKELFDEILIMFETDLSKKNITLLKFEIDGDKYLTADKQLLQQALINIISNAVKFTPEDGSIALTYKTENKKHIFSICDNGQGISKEDLQTLFNPFKQGGSAQKNVAKGTGLGLAITKKIIEESHNGNIWVKSKLNVGTCFYISL